VIKAVEIKHIFCPIAFLDNRAVYEIMWRNMVELDRPHMTMWRMRIACWVPKATDTHSEYVILIDFHYKNSYANAPECSSPALLDIKSLCARKTVILRACS
jgi:hypothetical protein